jgi:hypothetical protein
MDVHRGIKELVRIEYPQLVRCFTQDITHLDTLISRLSIASSGPFTIIYAPFEYINAHARVTIVGLTPGQAQMRIALKEAIRSLRSNSSWDEAIQRAKYAASFGGPMRSNLVRMLDYIGLNKWLKIDSCLTLFSTDQKLAHHTSVLRYPILKDGRNYSGQPSIARTPFLRDQVDLWFSEEIAELPQSVFVPLGAEAQNTLARLISEGRLSDDKTLVGLPHPSGANAERISYFLGRKRKDDLSRQTDAESLDSARAKLFAKVAGLSGLRRS